jgi:hypothetical protein
MKIFISMLIILSLNSQVFADTKVSDSDAEIIEIIEIPQNFSANEVENMTSAIASKKVTAAQMKKYLRTIDNDTTCMDEYMQRRRQLITKLVFSPVVRVAQGYAYAFGGLFVGAGLAFVNGKNGWEELGYAVGGALAGAAVSTVVSVVGINQNAKDIYDIDLMMKAIAEQRINNGGYKSDKLYAKFLSKTDSTMSKHEFFDKLIQADSNGTLCDGSMIKQPKIRFGLKLKYKVVRSKILFTQI